MGIRVVGEGGGCDWGGRVEGVGLGAIFVRLARQVWKYYSFWDCIDGWSMIASGSRGELDWTMVEGQSRVLDSRRSSF